MATVIFRYDYAKFLITCPGDLWHTYYAALNGYAHEMKFHGEWLKSHKVNRLWYNPDNGNETWSIDIWGEWAGLVEQLPIGWLQYLKRADVRSIIWDANKETVLDVGQHLQRNVTSHNIHVFNTKPASKRLGRDRGGVGFAIGSHKSDLRIACYKRTGEPVAQEFQCSGAMLKRLVDKTVPIFTDISLSYSAWSHLRRAIEGMGNQRLARVLESAGIGTYWPIIGAHDAPALPPTQAAFIPALNDPDEFPDEWGDFDEPGAHDEVAE